MTAIARAVLDSLPDGFRYRIDERELNRAIGQLGFGETATVTIHAMYAGERDRALELRYADETERLVWRVRGATVPAALLADRWEQLYEIRTTIFRALLGQIVVFDGRFYTYDADDRPVLDADGGNLFYSFADADAIMRPACEPRPVNR